MTTRDDDFVRLEMQGKDMNIPCKKLGLDWPPPEEIDVFRNLKFLTSF